MRSLQEGVWPHGSRLRLFWWVLGIGTVVDVAMFIGGAGESNEFDLWRLANVAFAGAVFIYLYVVTRAPIWIALCLVTLAVVAETLIGQSGQLGRWVGLPFGLDPNSEQDAQLLQRGLIAVVLVGPALVVLPRTERSLRPVAATFLAMFAALFGVSVLVDYVVESSIDDLGEGLVLSLIVAFAVAVAAELRSDPGTTGAKPEAPPPESR